MMFWLLAGAMVAAATLTLVAPLVRRHVPTASEAAYDREIYLARLREIETDAKLGRIGDAEAEAARNEEARRLLTASAAEASPSAARTFLPARPVAVALLLIVPATSLLLYLSLGQPGMPDMALAQRQDRDPAQQSILQLIERAEAQLEQRPDDLRGWTVVAPIYMRLGRYDDAADAWRNAVRLDPRNAEYRNSRAEALVAVASGVVTEEAREGFAAALKLRPGDPKARFYLALALSQQGALDEAEQAWRELLAATAPDAPWAPAAKAQLAAVLERAGKPADPALTAEAEAAPGPSAEDMEAAAQMSPADRQAMIEGMVANLAVKMEDDPSDKAGWLRLIRAYGVLGRIDEGRAAIASARDHFASDEAFLAELDGLSQGFETDGATE